MCCSSGGKIESVAMHIGSKAYVFPSNLAPCILFLLCTTLYLLGNLHRSTFVFLRFDIGTVAVFCSNPTHHKAFLTIVRHIPTCMFWIQNFKDELRCVIKAEKAVTIQGSPSCNQVGCLFCGMLGKAARYVLHNIAGHPILHSFQFYNKRCDSRDTLESPNFERPAF